MAGSENSSASEETESQPERWEEAPQRGLCFRCQQKARLSTSRRITVPMAMRSELTSSPSQSGYLSDLGKYQWSHWGGI